MSAIDFFSTTDVKFALGAVEHKERLETIHARAINLLSNFISPRMSNDDAMTRGDKSERSKSVESETKLSKTAAMN